jgi:hypothetical protein
MQTVESIKNLVQEQIEKINKPIIKAGLIKYLVEPTSHIRDWDYSTKGESFVCWTVAVDNSSDTSIVYCENGFGPKNPWGLVFTSKLYFGMDSGWFDNLEDCYLESFDAGELPIWFLEIVNRNKQHEIIAQNMTSDEAFKILDSIRPFDSKVRYHIMPRK